MGGWFEGTTTDDLLEGWWCEWDYAANRIIYYRLGRDQCYEDFLCHPRILSTCEAIAYKDHDLYMPSFPIYNGIWHGERNRLLFLQEQIRERPDLAEWLYYEAGGELECFRTEDGFQYTWQYPDGDDRPTYMRMRELRWSPVPPPITGRGAPPVKSAPRGTGLDTQAAATNQLLLANQMRQQQQQEHTAEAARQEAERLDALEEAEEQARDSERRVLELQRQKT